MTDRLNEIQKRVNGSREDLIQFMLDICAIPSMDSKIGPVGERIQAEYRSDTRQGVHRYGSRVGHW